MKSLILTTLPATLPALVFLIGWSFTVTSEDVQTNKLTGDWVYLTESVDENTFYMDSKRISQRDQHVNFWTLNDYPKRSEFGDMSSESYWQGDCDLFLIQLVNVKFYLQPMGEGTAEDHGFELDDNWESPPPKSIMKASLKAACDFSGKQLAISGVHFSLDEGEVKNPI